MTSFEAAPGYPETADESAIMDLLEQNKTLLAMLPTQAGTIPLGRRLNLLEPGGSPEQNWSAVATNLAMLERLRTPVGQDDIYEYRHPDNSEGGSTELHWEMPNPPCAPRRLFITEWHVRNPNGQIIFVNAEANTKLPLNLQAMLEQKSKTMESKLGNFIIKCAPAIGRSLGMLAYPVIMYQLQQEKRAKKHRP